VQVVFENPPGEPYLIRRRLTVHDSAGTLLTLDLWDADPTLSLDQWLAEVEGLTGPVEPNAVVAGQEALVRMQPGGCGVRPLVAAYLAYGHHVFRIQLPVVEGPASLETYEAMLRSFSLAGVDLARAPQTTLPDLQLLWPLACGINLCPSTCWGQCTFAATKEGCCGYPAIPYWQCSKACDGDQPGEFLGNCVWWGAYTRRDVGALAVGNNAETWAIAVGQTGQLPVDKTPKVGDIVVHPGSSWNHVAYVVWVSPDRRHYRMSDMGWCSDCGPNLEETKLRTVDGDDEFIHCRDDPPIPAVDWRFTTCPFGWTPSKGFADSSLTGSTWWLDPAGPAGSLFSAPILLSPLLSVPAGDYRQVRIEMANHALETAGRVYFTTADHPTFSDSRAVGFTTVNDGRSREVAVAMADHPQWQGTITRLALQPVLGGNGDGSDGAVEVDRIRLANGIPVTPTAQAYLPVVVRAAGPSPNQPPYPPSEPWPADGETELPVGLTLSWVGGDPDGDAVTYDVYLGAAGVPTQTLVCSGTLTTTCDVGPLSEATQYTWQVMATDEHSATTAGPHWAFTTVLTNHVPYLPSEPSPADGSTGLPVDLTLSWAGGDPDGDAVTYDVYLDPVPGLLETLVCSDTLTTTCDPGLLSEKTPYAWRVIATDEHSATTAGPLWAFTTVLTNQLPYPPSEPSPADGATGLPVTLTLGWAGGDPDGDDVTYDVYLDPAPGALETLVCSRTLTTTCDPGPLSDNTPYVWRVIATDEHSATAAGPVWSFTTTFTGCLDLVANGSFEGDGDWEIPSTDYPAAYSEAQAQGGSRSMRVGIIDPADNESSWSSARQLVTIPEGVTSATLRYWLYPVSREAAGAELPGAEALLTPDAQYVWILDPEGARLATLLSQQSNAQDWISYEADLVDYAGQAIKLYFGASNDGQAEATGMYVDDVSLEVCAAP
jgi:hypothetical protein